MSKNQTEETVIVVKDFKDKENKNKIYRKGDTFEGDSKRVSFLVSLGYLKVIVKEEPDNDPEKDLNDLGGGWYELPNGEKVKGKAEALKQLEGE